MIVQYFLQIGAAFIAWLGGLMPAVDIPASVASPGGILNSILAFASGLGVWIDWSFLGICCGVVVLAWSSGLLMKVGRAVIAHVPWFGGKG